MYAHEMQLVFQYDTKIRIYVNLMSNLDCGDAKSWRLPEVSYRKKKKHTMLKF